MYHMWIWFFFGHFAFGLFSQRCEIIINSSMKWFSRASYLPVRRLTPFQSICFLFSVLNTFDG